MKQQHKILIGKKDLVDFPDLDFYGVKCKIDSGADSCSIHARQMRLIKENGIEKLVCYIKPRTKTVFTEFQKKLVRSSNGATENRFVVKLNVILFDEIINVDFTLSNRGKMTFPVLLGKNILKGRFIIDVSFSNLSNKKQIKFA